MTPVEAPFNVDIALMSAQPYPDLGSEGILQVHPHISANSVTWAVSQGSILGAALWSEKRADRGEDAEPSFVRANVNGRALISVYDGLGGSGSAIARNSKHGPVTQAFDASRISRTVAERWFESLPSVSPDANSMASSLHDALESALVDRASTLGSSAGGLVGTLKRTLPTTIAAVVADTDGSNTRLTALWAGDSRCFVLTPTRGLQQISRDDTAIHDALESLLADPPIDNVVCADREFIIRQSALMVTEPFLVLVATDGCFGYVPSPPLFELQLLTGLESAASAAEWMLELVKQFDNQAQDDTSLALAAIGFQDFTAIQSAFRSRFEEMERTVGTSFAECTASQDRTAFEEFRSSSWESYKADYEALIPTDATVQ
jgi:hypothetical protein